MSERIFYRDTGVPQSSGGEQRGGVDVHTPLLFVHGDFSCGMISWSSQISSLSGQARLIIVDRRGHGKSPIQPRPYTVAADALDVIEVMDVAQAAQVHLIGHSYGGLVALEATLRAPERMRSLHLIEPPYLSLLPDDPDVASLAGKTGAVHAAATGWDPERIAREFFAVLLGVETLSQLRTKSIWPALVNEAERFGYEQFAGAYPPQAVRSLSAAGPVFLYTGGRSHPGLQKTARHLAAAILDARLIAFPEAAHDVQRVGAAFDASLIAATQGGPY